MVSREVRAADSKFIAFTLRRKPEEIGISLDEHGWSDVDELVRGISKTRPLPTTCSKRLQQRQAERRGVWVRRVGRCLARKSRCEHPGAFGGPEIGFVIAFGVIGNTKTQVVDVLELHGLYHVVNR